MAIRDAQFFSRIFKAITRFYRNPRLTYAIVDGYYFGRKPTLKLLRFLLPLYRRYTEDQELINQLYLAQDKDLNVRKLLIQEEPVLSEAAHSEFARITNLPINQQEKAQDLWVQKLESAPNIRPENQSHQTIIASVVSKQPEAIADKSAVMVVKSEGSLANANTETSSEILRSAQNLTQSLSQAQTPSFVKNILLKSELAIKQLSSKLTPMQLISLFTGLVGAVTGYGIAGITGGVAGASAAFLPSVLAKGGGQTIINIGSSTINTSAEALQYFSRYSARGISFNIIPSKTLKYILLSLLGGFVVIAILGAGFNNPTGTGGGSVSSGSSKGFVGVNIHSLASLEPTRIEHILNYLNNSCGVSIIRVWGTPDRGGVDALKKTLDIGSKHNVKFIIALADYPNRPNDFLEFSQSENPTGWYKEDYKTKYRPYVENVVTALRGHPAVYAWELANEPHCNGNTECVEPYYNWVQDISSLIKNLDPVHLVSIGTMARRNIDLGDSVDDGQYEKNNALPAIGALSGHYYEEDLTSEKQFMLKDLAVAKKLNKPFYIGEVGFRCGTEPCTLASSNNEVSRATLLHQEMTEFFNAGATGYLIWQYSDRKSDYIDNDPYSFFEGDPICQMTKEVTGKLKEVPVNTSLASCQYIRSDQNPKAVSLKSSVLAGYFQEAAKTTSVPTSILAGIARLESPGFTANADDNHDALQNKGFTDLSKSCAPHFGGAKGASTTGALGLMQLQPKDTRGHFAVGIDYGASFLGKTADQLNIADYCDVRQNIIMAAGFILKKMQAFGYGDGKKWDPNWTNDKTAINRVAEGFYGCLEYGGGDPLKCTGPYSYGDDLWTSVQSCQQTPSGCPVTGTITNPYGHNIAGYQTSDGRPIVNENCGNLTYCHNGIDIATSTGTDVKSTIEGEVSINDYDSFKGNYLEITHSNTTITYEHLQSRSPLSVGSKVSKGMVVGKVGSIGESTGEHLHYKIKINGTLANPLRYIGQITSARSDLLLSSDSISLNNYSGVNIGNVTNFGSCNNQP